MQIINKEQEDMYSQRVAAVEATQPQSLEVIQHPEDEEPKDIGNGIIVMPGDYYAADGSMVIAHADIGTNGAWRVVSP